MNEDYFTGFEKNYIFFDNDNNMMFSFYNNGVGEIFSDDNVYNSRWRFSKQKGVIEIFSSELDVKVLYKLKILKDDKESGDSFLQANFSIKYGDEDKGNVKGVTTILRSINNISTYKESFNSKFEKASVLVAFVLLFSVILLIVSFIPFFDNAGVLYSSAIILVIQILFIKKIKHYVNKLIKKYETTIKSIFYS